MNKGIKDNQELISLSTDLTEIAIDSLLKDGILKDIPLVNLSLSIGKLVGSVSDKLLLKKLITFINTLDLKSEEEIEQFKVDYFKNIDYPKIGSKILLIIDKADDETKVIWLAQSLRLFVDKIIDKDEFIRISSIINSCYVEDVKHLLLFKNNKTFHKNNQTIKDYTLEHLNSVGLLKEGGYDGGKLFGTVPYGSQFSLSHFGEIFLNQILLK